MSYGCIVAVSRENLNETLEHSYPSDLIESVKNFNLKGDSPIVVVFTFKQDE